MTETKERKPWQFQPGQSGNPAGRPVGSRNQLGTAFVDALKKDFEVHGEAVIAQVRQEKPDQYLKVISNIVPKELLVKTETIEDLSDDDLIGLLSAVRSLTAKGSGKKAERRTKPEEEGQEVRGKPN